MWIYWMNVLHKIPNLAENQNQCESHPAKRTRKWENERSAICTEIVLFLYITLSLSYTHQQQQQQQILSICTHESNDDDVHWIITFTKDRIKPK